MLMLASGRSTEDWLLIVALIVAIICGVVWLIHHIR